MSVLDEIPAQPALRACRVCGREGETMPVRGPYANRCADCRAKKGREISGRSAASTAGVDQADSFEAKAKLLVSHGRRVDGALADVRLKAVGLNDAKALARQALEQWRTACVQAAHAGERSQ